ncbi:hypothetical protein SETIT_4G091100v2 [Setaria italica]|uniref:Uncharacterized protein n=1 Tax=Setaria italica TaxID=4555 RepID=K3Y0C7_SETIT|nr:hypothetical protein SETIT_4G091100v2 [Setaria italica]
MAREAEAALRPFVQAAGGDGEVISGGPAATAFLATDRTDRPVDPVIWGDEKRMKRELVAWAKAVASMSAGKNTSCSSTPSSTPSPSMRRGRV